MNSHNSLGKIKEVLTSDGTPTFHSELYDETFHSMLGARLEAQEKFIKPSKLHERKHDKPIRVLDVCFGLGYNTACLLEEVRKMKNKIKWYGLEIDHRPIESALMNNSFLKIWTATTRKKLQSISTDSGWSDSTSSGQILWGDARETLKEIPLYERFDLIYLDPFSPRKCPQLWSEEFLESLTMRLSSLGRLVTYSRSAALRASLRRKGLTVLSLKPLVNRENDWSAGTLAIKGNCNEVEIEDHVYQSLNQMEEEHLKTTAAVPYRDPTGKSTAVQILNIRKQEQKNSELINTKSWKDKWIKVKILKAH